MMLLLDLLLRITLLAGLVCFNNFKLSFLFITRIYLRCDSLQVVSNYNCKFKVYFY